MGWKILKVKGKNNYGGLLQQINHFRANIVDSQMAHCGNFWVWTKNTI